MFHNFCLTQTEQVNFVFIQLNHLNKQLDKAELYKLKNKTKKKLNINNNEKKERALIICVV